MTSLTQKDCNQEILRSGPNCQKLAKSGIINYLSEISFWDWRHFWKIPDSDVRAYSDSNEETVAQVPIGRREGARPAVQAHYRLQKNTFSVNSNHLNTEHLNTRQYGCPVFKR